ncbi:MAG: response regulator [Desulfobacteraceae bacterium]|nr:response regulator [Desulfobacteraceae bacterium]
MSTEHWKVLIIDDEEGIRKVMSITLSDAGYEVLTAADGESGLKLSDEKSPQIILTDIRMPGMDGLEVLKQIKKGNSNKEVIVVTAFGEMELAVRALQLDASDFITKPIHDEALFVALERAKGRYKTRKEIEDYTEILEERWMDTAEELARAFDFQNNLIESSIDGIMAWKRDGRVITFNKALQHMLGYFKDEVIGKMSFDQFFPPGGAKGLKESLYSEAYGGKNQLFLFETNLISKTQKKLPVQLSARVLFDEGKEIGIVGFFRDLREIRRLEQQFTDQTQLLHQDKMISMGRLAASMVHEINNPLAGILNYIRLMIKIIKRDTLEPEKIKKFPRYLGLVESETSRCSKIVSNLLAFSRKSEMKFAEIDMADLLQRCVMLSQHKLTLQNIQIKTESDPAVPPIWGDFNQIQQCIINLIFNAIDAMPEGGTLAISSSFEAGEGVVQIKVEDTGCGIAKEDIPYIFDRFFTTKEEGKGIGLGLSTVQGVIDRHKGSIDVRSKQREGTTVTIKLPIPTPDPDRHHPVHTGHLSVYWLL